MGLGSKEEQQRQELRTYAGKHDWKAAIKTPDDAKELVRTLKAQCTDDIGKYIIDAYMGQKILWLERYIQSGSGVTFKEYVRTNK
jgi:hypothetical protein